MRSWEQGSSRNLTKLCWLVPWSHRTIWHVKLCLVWLVGWSKELGFSVIFISTHYLCIHNSKREDSPVLCDSPWSPVSFLELGPHRKCHGKKAQKRDMCPSVFQTIGIYVWVVIQWACSGCLVLVRSICTNLGHLRYIVTFPQSSLSWWHLIASNPLLPWASLTVSLCLKSSHAFMFHG